MKADRQGKEIMTKMFLLFEYQDIYSVPYTVFCKELFTSIFLIQNDQSLHTNLSIETFFISQSKFRHFQ